MAMKRKHLLYDLWLADEAIDTLAYVGLWPDLLQTAAAYSGAKIIGKQFHQFEPQGVTGFLLLAESHISIHTWPEENLITLDIFTCGNLEIDILLDYLRTELKPVKEKLTIVARGEASES